MNDVLSGFMQTLGTQIQLPTEWAWAFPVGAAGLGLFGLVMLLNGARLARAMTAGSLLLVGGAAGLWLSEVIATPKLPTMLVAGVVGLLVGLGLFRLWLAGLMAGSFVLIGLTCYTGTVLWPHLTQYTTAGLSAETQEVTLPAAGTVTDQAQKSLSAEWQRFTGYLAEHVPNLNASVGAIVISTALAGLIFGLLLPRTSRAVLASTVGTVCIAFAVAGILKVFWPDAFAYLANSSAGTWVGLGIMWLASFVLNLVRCKDKKAAAAKDEDGPAAVVLKPLKA